MAEQPKLREGLAEADWWHVAREFRDHDMETEAGWEPHITMEPVTDAYYIGDWLPVEDVCKEVVRLRAENAKLRAAGEALAESTYSIVEQARAVDPVSADAKFRAAASIEKARAAWREAAGESREAAGKERSDGE